MKFLLFLILSFFIIDSSGQFSRSVDEAKGLAVGTKAPLFMATDGGNQTFILASALKKGPVVLIFYRGQWCPVCNKHLSQIQDSLKFITNKGAMVVAVSPEKPEYLEKMADKTGAEFTLIFDEGYSIANSYDVTFTPKSSELIVYNTILNAKLKEAHSDDSQQLPIPATYIIGQDGTIVWRQFNPDYKKRSTVKEILKNIP